MSEAEVAQQLIADLQANIGVISGFIIVLLLGGLLALGTTLSNASRALRELQEGVSGHGKGDRSPQMAYGARDAGSLQASRRPRQVHLSPSRPIGRELPLARKSAPRHQGRSMTAPGATHRRPRRTGDRHSLI